MSWIRETKKSWAQSLALRTLKNGPIPQHVAFIMDGNRRYAKRNNFDRAKGHLMGFDKLAETLEWCQDLGIKEVTVYAFSIENFKRSKDEVDCLMELAREKFSRLMEEKENLKKHGVCIRVLGDLTLLPLDIQKTIAEAVHFTKDHDRATMNVCFAYTSREEICAAMRETAEGVQLGLIKETDISERLLEQCLYTNRSIAPDLLVRTSGEVRLSDFLLWQSSYSVLSFMKVLWPDFSFWNLCAGILHYQQNYEKTVAAREEMEADRERAELEQDHACVLEELRHRHATNGTNGTISIAPSTGTDSGTRASESVLERVHAYSAERRRRTQRFLEHVNDKRAQYFAHLLHETPPTPTPVPVVSPTTAS